MGFITGGTVGRARSILPIILVALFISTCLADTRGKNLVSQIEDAANDLENGSIREFQLDGNIDSICFQGPYTSKENYEQGIGRKISDFHVINSDASLRLHLFFEDGSQKQLFFQDSRLKLDKTRLERGCLASNKFQMEKHGEFVFLFYQR